MAKRKADNSDDSASTATKKPKLTKTKATTPKAPRKSKKKPEEPQEPEEPPKPKVKRINKALKAKIKQVGDFLDSTSREESRLTRHSENENHVVVTEAALLGSLMTLRGDWELTDPRVASVLDASDSIVEEYQERIGAQGVLVKMVVLDLQKEIALVESIHQMTEGWDLEEINLLEVELELYHRAAEQTAAVELFSAVEEADPGTGEDNATSEATEAAEGIGKDSPRQSSNDESKPSTEEDTDSPSKGDTLDEGSTESLYKDEDDRTTEQDFEEAITKSKPIERKQYGICPAPMKEPDS